MYTASPSTAPTGGIAGALRRSEAWLDRKGKFAWIAAMILGFILFWPLGLALLGYMIWSNRMFNRSSCQSRRMDRDWGHRHGRHMGTTGNATFDAYKADALKRLEDEQEAFEAFIQRLREAKDKAQFDSFMEDRAQANRAQPVETTPTPATDNRGGAY